MDFTTQQQQPQTPPKNWLVESILATIFCCVPLGIVSIVYAAQVNSKFNQGDYQGAVDASANAAKWTKITFWVGIGVLIIYLAFIFLFGGMAILTGARNNTY